MCAMENLVFNLKDVRPTPDPIYPYSDNLISSPLIIDNGAYQCRAGWAAEEKPKLIFKSIMAKQRGKKDCEAQIGNDISNIEVVRWLLKTQFDRNVVTQYDVQEQIFDYVFNHLGINSLGTVDHPIVLTEATANPNYSRQLMSELLFECYHVPSVAYGIDSLFSFRHNNTGSKGDHAMIVSCGYHTTHILPVLGGKLDLSRTKRINLGGNQVTSFLHRLLQLKYPAHFAAITLSRAEELLHNHTHIANDYEEALGSWKSDADYYSKNVHCIQLPYTPLTANTSNVEAQKERKLQQVRRLQEMNAKRREERLAADEEKLQQLLSIQELLEEEDEDAFNKALEEVGYSTHAELQLNIGQLNTRIQRTKDKMFITNKDDDSSQEPKVKRYCVEFDANKYGDFTSWIASVKQKRQELLESRAQRRQKKSDMAKRRTLASQERMKIISQLAADKKKEDNFGQNDDDWQVYKAINRDGGDTDSEEEQEKLQEMEQILREHDLEFQKEMETSQEPNFTFNLAEYYQLHLGVERIRVPELLFQPSMMGIEQAGIVESLEFILSKYSPELQNKMVQNVFLTGGCALFPGFKIRLERELLAIRPFQTEFRVTMAENPVLDAWNGARAWALNSENVSKFSITRADYDEKGGEYLKEHSASNFYYPSPPPVVVPTKPIPVNTAVTTATTTSATTSSGS